MEQEEKGKAVPSFEEFKEDILWKVSYCPSEWRKGQSVFNVVDAEYGVAREVQFVDGIDCFYSDGRIDEFLAACYRRIFETGENSEER